MHLKRLSIYQYRNIEKVDIFLDPGFNVFWGDNAQGKTNLLESIYLLGSLKSFRNAKNEDLVRHGSPACRLTGEIHRQGANRRIDIEIDSQGKRARVDGKEARTAADFFGSLNPVLFSPEDVAIARGSPGERRALIDRAIFQSDFSYLDRVRDYERHLRQRNRLLREGRPSRELDPWTEGLIRSGARIRCDRQRYMERIRPVFGEIYRNISGEKETAELFFSWSEADSVAMEVRMRSEIASAEPRERRLGQTLAGPHRDDPFFVIDGRPAKTFASQGQQRSVVLAFKTAQIIDLEKLTGEPPVLLLDDMTSELDRRRQSFFFRFLLERQGQVFITTTEADPLVSQGFGQARLFRVKEGSLCQNFAG